MTGTKPKRGLAALFALCPGRHVLLLVSALVVLLHLLLRRDHALMQQLSERVVHPLHQLLSRLNGHLPFSVAEVLIGAFVLGVLALLAVQLVRLVLRPERGKRLYRLVVTLLGLALFVYALFCLMWGVYYYGDDFMEKSGLKQEKISTGQLAAVTQYFADLANEYAMQVPRDEDGLYAGDRAEILKKSPEVFRAVEQDFPCLAGPEVAAKGVHFSRIMSYTDFTGFFFPFTAEANVNTDFPPTLFASTVAHELSHQRGVAKEQEANFTAVLASLRYGDPDYVYSAAMLAYIHLGNALYKADHAAWEQVYGSLSAEVLADLRADSTYWKQFRTPVQSVSNTVYQGFLQSYDQTLGLKSYGACVDLLVNYYYEKIA